MEKLKVGVIFGGRSGEHEVSLRSATSIVEALDPEKYQLIPMGITREGAWIAGENAWKLLQGDTSGSPWDRALWMPDPQNPGIATLEKSGDRWVVKEMFPLEVVFPVLHGPYGEDGTIQGMLEMADIPYVGSGVLASSLGMDKVVMKQLYQQAGLPVGPYLFFKKNQWDEQKEVWKKSITQELGFPCFVKPANLGSSVGISKVSCLENLDQAIDEAARHDCKILVEAALEGREIECSVLGDEHPRASLPGEIVPCNDFYDYHAKYLDDRSELIIPADIPTALVEKVQQLSIAAFNAIEATGLARVDFFVDTQREKIVINEINTMPGFTSISMYPKLWEVSGLPYNSLLDELIQMAIKTHRKKQMLAQCIGDSTNCRLKPKP